MEIRKVNWNYGTSFACDFHEPIEMQRQLLTWFASENRTRDLIVADTRGMVARLYGFGTWEEFTASLARPKDDPRSAPVYKSSAPPFYKIDWSANRISVQGGQTDKDWDTVFAVVKEYGLAELHAGGITDSAMARIPRLESLTSLHIMDSKPLTDEGALHLVKLPHLRDLEIGGWTSTLTDRGFDALSHLTELRRIHSCWTPGLTDVGAANLAGCEHLEDVNLMGTATGDKTLRMLAGKPVHHLHTGRGVTDAGLALLHQFPIFRTWHGGEIRYGLMGANAQPNRLMVDGPFTDAGVENLIGLDGVAALGFFWHCSALTSQGLAPLKQLPHLHFLACPGERCDDEAMRHISAMPHLGMLMGQGAVATDDGFAALSHSQTIQYVWGRECPNLTGRGFAALRAMPALRGLAVSCKNVDDASLATLPNFPFLDAFMPMDVPDAGFRHVGRCEKLESLWCMYCRDTGDVATEHIAGRHLKTYYAGMTMITDRSLEILGRMTSLEHLEFWQCLNITNEGVARLTTLPNLREITVEGSPSVTREAMARFPEHVRTNHFG